VRELAMKNTDVRKLIWRLLKLTKEVPENMRPMVAIEEQIKASEFAIMNASNVKVPPSVGAPRFV
jgi:hypothetical protein